MFRFVLFFYLFNNFCLLHSFSLFPYLSIASFPCTVYPCFSSSHPKVCFSCPPMSMSIISFILCLLMNQRRTPGVVSHSVCPSFTNETFFSVFLSIVESEESLLSWGFSVTDVTLFCVCINCNKSTSVFLSMSINSCIRCLSLNQGRAPAYCPGLVRCDGP